LNLNLIKNAYQIPDNAAMGDVGDEHLHQLRAHHMSLPYP